MDPVPTHRAVVDVGRKCQTNCKFCYYKHLGDLRKQGWTNKDVLKKQIKAAKNRGNNYIDFTGGEPIIYPYMKELVSYVHELDMKCCIITNALSYKNIPVDDYLISIHGLEGTHNYLVDCKNARQLQLKFLSKVKRFRFNFVINKFNHDEIYETTEFMLKYKPYIVNFINMNPHHGWKDDPDVTNIIADLSIVEPSLNRSIKLLENNGIGVNVRYYPMCRIAEEYRRCVCNDLHVAFDPYEWDYPRTEKKLIHFVQWAINLSNEIEEKSTPCCDCDLQYICGGINKYFNAASDNVCIPQKNTKIGHKHDFYWYRRKNQTIKEDPYTIHI